MQSEDVRAKYFEEADRLRMEHKEQHPNWSHRDNYVRTACSHVTAGELRKPAELRLYLTCCVCL